MGSQTARREHTRPAEANVAVAACDIIGRAGVLLPSPAASDPAGAAGRALAHAHLIRADLAPNSHVLVSVGTVRFWFDEPLNPASHAS